MVERERKIMERDREKGIMVELQKKYGGEIEDDDGEIEANGGLAAGWKQCLLDNESSVCHFYWCLSLPYGREEEGKMEKDGGIMVHRFRKMVGRERKIMERDREKGIMVELQKQYGGEIEDGDGGIEKDSGEIEDAGGLEEVGGEIEANVGLAAGWKQCLLDNESSGDQIKQSLNVDAIIRGGLRRYTDQLGHLWNSLADYYVRSGLFERVSPIF
ncbi:unnamed protein product, partial [Timema podura]|nr:unnamed protein product [Timema podura]